MGSFSKFLESLGIHLQPAAFIGIIAGALLLFLVFVIGVVYVHRRTKRKIMEGAFDKPDISILSFTHPRPPLLARHSSSRSSLVGREVQQQDIVGREVRQQEATYAQLIADLQKPVALALPNQTPREYTPWMGQWDATEVDTPSSLAARAVEDTSLGAPHLQRGHSIRSLDSASVYSVASALPDAPGRAHQSFNALATFPAPQSPGPYIWPKRQRLSLIRDDLAPETYAKARWRTDGESVDPTATIPVARSVPSAKKSPTFTRTAQVLRKNVDHRTAFPTALSQPQRPY